MEHVIFLSPKFFFGGLIAMLFVTFLLILRTRDEHRNAWYFREKKSELRRDIFVLLIPCALLALIVGRPASLGAPESASCVETFLMLDGSRSTKAEDVLVRSQDDWRPGNRADLIRAIVLDLVDRCKGANFGYMAYATATVAPTLNQRLDRLTTTDHDALRWVLEHWYPPEHLFSRLGGSDPVHAFDAIADQIRFLREKGVKKDLLGAIVILTDGGGRDANDTTNLVTAYHKMGLSIPVYVVIVGDIFPVPIPEYWPVYRFRGKEYHKGQEPLHRSHIHSGKAELLYREKILFTIDNNAVRTEADTERFAHLAKESGGFLIRAQSMDDIGDRLIKILRDTKNRTELLAHGAYRLYTTPLIAGTIATLFFYFVFVQKKNSKRRVGYGTFK